MICPGVPSSCPVASGHDARLPYDLGGELQLWIRRGIWVSNMTECEAPKIVSLLSFVPVTVIQRSFADFKSHLGRRFEHERGIA